jgi:hypothetical protein
MDNDHIPGIAPRFRRAYKTLCEQNDPADAEVAIRNAFKRTVTAGDELPSLVLHVGAVATQAIADAGLDIEAGCIAASHTVDETLSRADLPHRLIEIVREETARWIGDRRHRRATSLANAGQEILERVNLRIYEPDFADPARDRIQHYSGTDPEIIAERLDVITPVIEKDARSLAEQVAIGKKKLRLPPRKRPPPLGLHEDNLL